MSAKTTDPTGVETTIPIVNEKVVVIGKVRLSNRATMPPHTFCPSLITVRGDCSFDDMLGRGSDPLFGYIKLVCRMG